MNQDVALLAILGRSLSEGHMAAVSRQPYMIFEAPRLQAPTRMVVSS